MPNARSRPKVASLTVIEVFVDFAGLRVKAVSSPRHCAERATKQSILPAPMDGLLRRSLSSGARSRDPLARSDGLPRSPALQGGLARRIRGPQFHAGAIIVGIDRKLAAFEQRLYTAIA